MPKILPNNNTGYGIIEAPRGLLLHQMETGADGNVIRGDVVVPTGQNQISIEQSIHHFVEKNLNLPKDQMKTEIEKIIRAYDPCMSCATHFLKVNWS